MKIVRLFFIIKNKKFLKDENKFYKQRKKEKKSKF